MKDIFGNDCDGNGKPLGSPPSLTTTNNSETKGPDNRGSDLTKNCDHEWNNEGCDPEYCLKCGMTFWRYVFTECP